MIKISLKGLAKFMTARASAQRKVLHDFKYPDPEGHVQALYYREARDAVEGHHANPTLDVLGTAANTLMTQAGVFSGQKATRLKNNARAVTAYAASFAKKKWTPQPQQKLAMNFSGVLITVFPDLIVREANRTKLVKLEFSSEEPADDVVKILGQSMFVAATTAGLGVKSADVLVLDVPRGVTHQGARMGSRMESDILAACKNISALWPTI